jgi:hypothetical protein
MSIEDNMKIVSGLRRMGVMGSEVPQVEAMLAEGKTVKEVADHFACDESVIEAFATVPAKAPVTSATATGPLFPGPPYDDDDKEEEKPRGKRK